MESKDSSAELIGGVEKRDIVIVSYDPKWPDMFEQHKLTIAKTVGKSAHAIEHIGSTAVPGLAAKPIIDILLVVEESGNKASYLPQLERAGYELRVREPDFEEHRMLRMPARGVHLHVLSNGSPEVERYLRFRDRLRESEVDRKTYEEVKLKLASESWKDMNAYAEAKSDVIKEIMSS